MKRKWARLIAIRNETNKALEIRRQNKFIGNSLEAKVIICLPEKEFNLLNEYKGFLPALFIVSSAEARQASGKIDGAYESEEIKGMSVIVERASGKKCERCWNWSTSVGTYSDAAELCHRCYNVVK